MATKTIQILGSLNADTQDGFHASDLANEIYVGDQIGDAATAPINADTLGGIPAEDYATENFVAVKIAEVQLDGSDVDLSGYATKDELNAKQNTISGGASTITSSNLTASRALVSNGSGKVAVSDITSTELGYLDGITSNIQTQINNKVTNNASGLTSLLSKGNMVLTSYHYGTALPAAGTKGRIFFKKA